MAKKKFRIPGLSFSWKRATGISSLKSKVARATGIPTTREGRRRKFGPFGLWWLLGLLGRGSEATDSAGEPMGYVSVTCPRCGLKLNLQQSSLGTLRECKGCGQQIVVRDSGSSFGALGGCLAVMGVCALLGVCGCGGVLMLPALFPTTPPNSTAKPAPPKPAAISTPKRDATAALPPPDSAPAPAETSMEPPAVEIPAAPAFDAAVVVLTSEETAERTRTFKTTDGKFSTEAVFLAMRDEIAYLRKLSTGSVVEVPMGKLANSDRIWIRRIAAADKAKARSNPP